MIYLDTPRKAHYAAEIHRLIRIWFLSFDYYNPPPPPPLPAMIQIDRTFEIIANAFSVHCVCHAKAIKSPNRTEEIIPFETDRIL